MQVFAVANSGVEVRAASLEHALGSPITWGVIAGLIAGKPIGVLRQRPRAAALTDTMVASPAAVE